LAVLCSLLSSCDFKQKFRTLADWEKHTARPGFRLLDSMQTKDYLIAIYDTGRDEIAFCYRWRGSDPGNTTTLGIWDEYGRSIDDVGRSHRTDLSWSSTITIPLIGPIVDGGHDGTTTPIRPGYYGVLWISFSDEDEQGGSYRTIYEKAVDMRSPKRP
jgi:hypothetical protein